MNEDRGTVRADDGVELAWRRVGEGGPMVLVPAMSWLLDDVAPLAQGRTLLGYDVRGQGCSARVGDHRIGLQRDVADLDAVCRTAGVERVAVLGWSYYGAVALRWAFEHPERVERLLLAAPVAPRAQPHWRGYLAAFGKKLDVAALGRLEQQRREGLRQRDPEAWCRAHVDLILRVYVDDPGSLARMRASPCVEPNLDPERVNQQTLKVLEGMGDYDWREEMAGMAVPALLMHGDRDPVPLEGSREWCATLAAAELDVLVGCGHMPWLEQPERFFARADAFLPHEAGR